MVLKNILECREGFPESGKEAEVHFSGDGYFAARAAGNDGPSHRIQKYRFSRIITFRVASDAVDSDHETLVFDGPGLEQSVPGAYPAARPAGYEYGKVVIRSSVLAEGIAAGFRETDCFSEVFAYYSDFLDFFIRTTATAAPESITITNRIIMFAPSPV